MEKSLDPGKIGRKITQPFWSTFSNPAQFAVRVFRYLFKSVFIVEKDGFVAVGQNGCQSFPAAGKPAEYILTVNVMPAVVYTVLNAGKAFLHTVEANIVKPYKIAEISCPTSGLFCPIAGEGGFLRER